MDMKRVVAWTWVGIQAILLIAILLIPSADDWSVGTAVEVVGRALEVLGLALGIWGALALGRGLTPSPLPNGRTALVSHGPYRLVRHPIYAAVILFMAGVVVLKGSWIAAVPLALLIGLFYFKSRWEEDRLVETFDGYAEYRASVGRFLPGVGRK